MASAMIRGITASGLMHTDQITVSSPVFSPELLQMDQQDVGLTLSGDNGASVQEAELVFLCVKPDILPIATESITKTINENQVFFSIAAGTPCEKVENVRREPLRQWVRG
jgi:pyrroline-5-carboxylate reductase